MKKYINKNRGFTIIETLTALFILSIVVSVGYSSATSGLTSLFGSRDRTTAFFLAQEGVEYVKNWREDNIFNGLTWDLGFNTCSGGCAVDVISGTVQSCSGDSCKLSKNSDGFFVSDAGSETNFRRTVSIENVNTDEVKVISTVSWTGFGGGNVSVVENIFNWREI